MTPFLIIWSWLRNVVGTISKINPDHVAPNALGSRDILTIFLECLYGHFGNSRFWRTSKFGWDLSLQIRPKETARRSKQLHWSSCTRRFHRQQLFGSFKTSQGRTILIWVRVGDILTVTTNIFKHQPCIFLTSRFCLGYTWQSPLY